MIGRGLIAALVSQAIVIGLLLTLSLDVYAHKRVEQLGGVNIWGYRGQTAREKKPNEIRVGVVGGTVAFGWGVAASETTSAGIRQLVSLAMDRRGQTARPVTAINLAAMGWPPSSYPARLNDFSKLGFDVICIYPDPEGTTRRSQLPQAPVVGGYTPILSLVAREKLGISPAVASGAPLRIDESDRAAVVSTVLAARSIAAHGTVLVLPSPATGLAYSGWEQLVDRFAGDPRVRVVDLAGDGRLRDLRMRLDENSFGAGGNAVAAEQIAPAVIELLQSNR